MTYSANDHTFVVCAYKESPYLECLIESLERQNELGSILVSTSTPNDHIAAICSRHGLDVVVNDGESSIAHDWNYGYDQAKTPLVTIAHQDDVYDPGYLPSVLDAFNRNAGIGVVHTDYFELREGGRVYSNRLLKIKRQLNKRYERVMLTGGAEKKRHAFRFGDFVCCPSVTFDKSVVGPSVFDVRYRNSCDYRTWIDLASRGISFAYVPEPLMGHRIYEGSTTTANIADDTRSNEDREIMSSLWPKPIARLVSKAYESSQSSNDL